MTGGRFLAEIGALADSLEPTPARLESLIQIGFTSLKEARPLLRGIVLFESSQMNLLQGNLDKLCTLIEKILSGQGEDHSGQDPRQRRALIRITVVGILFSVALAEPSNVDREIRSCSGPLPCGCPRADMAGGRARRAISLLLLLSPAVAVMAEPAPLTLDQAIELARRSSEAIRISRLALEKSLAALGEARGKALPHVDLEASASYLVNPPPGYTVAAGALGTLTLPNPTPPPMTVPVPIPPSAFNVGAALHNYFSVTASLNQPLFTWGKIKNAIDLASLQVDSAGTSVSARERDIDGQVRRTYFSALLAHTSQDALRRMTDTAREVVADRQKSFDQERSPGSRSWR